jgi:uncharacterized protein (DUF433 family)
MKTDWKDCSLVECVPGKMNGLPVIKGTRIRAQTIIDNFEAGSPVEEISENYPSVPVESIRKLIDYAHSRQPQPR